MKQYIKLLIGMMLMTIQTVIVPDGVEAQLGKIHRKYAQVTISPEVVTQGNSFFVTVQSWQDLEEWHLQVLDSGNSIAEKTFTAQQPVMQHEFTLPDGAEGEKTIRLLGKENGRWSILQEKSVELLPGFYQEVKTLYDELKQKEADSSIRQAWSSSTVAAANDLLERMKSASSGDGRGLRNRLNDLKAMAEKMKENKDPYQGKTGYQLRGYVSPDTGETQLYSLYVPKDYDPQKEYPMVVMLHGAWSNHHLALRRVMGKTNRRGEDDSAAKRSMPELPDVPYLVLAPNGFETMEYQGVAENDVWFTISQVHSIYHFDLDRVYLTGLSMGGGGTGRLGIKTPGMFAAIAPVCGYFEVPMRGGTDELPAFVKRLYELKSPINMAENLLHVPVKIMHGDADPVVPPEQSRKLHEALRKMEYHSELEMYPGVDHDAWTPAYENARIFDWFSQYKRNRFHKQVKYKSAEPGGAYWMSVLGLEKIRQFASAEADIHDGSIVIKTDNVEKLLLSLSQELLPLNKEYNLLINDNAAIMVTPSDFPKDSAERNEIMLTKNDGKWEAGKMSRNDRLLPLLEGLSAPVKSNHVYIYGSNGNEKEIKQAQQLAIEKSFWGDMTDVRWKVLPENEVDYSTQKTGIVLISKINNSSYIQDHIHDLPISIQGERIHFGDKVIEKDQGLVFVQPNPELGTYITICTAATNEGMKALASFAQEEFSFFGGNYGDFVCFDKDGKPLWGGLFDKHWKIETVEDY